jgi:TonB family protein
MAEDKGTTLVSTVAGNPSSMSGGAGYGQRSPGTGSGTGDVAVINGTRRRALVDGYRNELLRTRIAAHFRYPAEAREMELIGQVVVAVTIRKDGHLLNVRLAGRCPHAILCTDGLRTIRASAPFPPIPDVLGDSLQIEVPFNYNFE